MASSADIARLRTMVDEPDTDVYSDVALGAVIDQAGDLNSAAVEIWEQKAGRYASLVDTSESGSSRKMSQLHSNAEGRAKYYREKIVALNPTPTRGARTRSAERR